ncbi:MAG: amino acid adenylation domain-containing protein, partial [Legionellaceae bacterium]|nr:amino acid adenylation domain-containing protein [Legionellaceae bacterium]
SAPVLLSADDHLVSELKRLSIQEASHVLQERLSHVLADLLQYNATQSLDPHKGFFELGMDSLTAIEFGQRIEFLLHYNLKVTPKTLFDYPTIIQLSHYLLSTLSELQVDNTPIYSKDSRLLKNDLPPHASIKENKIPLASNQKSIYFLSKLSESSNASYNEQFIVKIKENADIEKIKFALYLLVQRHIVLRLKVVEAQEELHQEESQYAMLSIEKLSVADKEEIEKITLFEKMRAFDLNTAPLARVLIIKKTDHDYHIVFTIHHLIIDLWSMVILSDDFHKIYNELANDIEAKLPVLNDSFLDYVLHKNQFESTSTYQEGIHFWKTYLHQYETSSFIKNNYRLQNSHLITERLSIEFSDYEKNQINDISKKHNVTTFSFIVAAISLLLSRFSAQSDIVVGSMISNREQEEFKRTVGFFATTLAYRFHINSDQLLSDYLQNIFSSMLDAQQHSFVNFSDIVSELNVDRRVNENPIFQIMINEVNFLKYERNIEHNDLTLHNSYSKFPLNIQVRITKDSMKIEFIFDQELNRKGIIFQFVASFNVLIHAMLIDQKSKIGKYNILTTKDIKKLSDWNSTERSYPKNNTLHQLFEQQVLRTPDDTAVVCGDDHVTYWELNSEANKLARYLRECYERQGTKLVADTPIVFCMHKSLSMVIAILGILKAGGAYVPIDPHYPSNRIKFMISDTKSLWVLSHGDLSDKLQSILEKNVSIINMDRKVYQSYEHTNLITYNCSSDLAYIVYTSGTTGTPKGVMISHRNAVQYIHWIYNHEPYQNASVIDCSSNIAYGSTVKVFFPPLVFGKKLIICGEETKRDTKLYFDYLEKNKVTLINVTASYLSALIGYIESKQASFKLPHIHCLIVGNERVNPNDIIKWKLLFPACHVIHHYGSTEITVGCTSYSIDDSVDLNSLDAIPLGRVASNTKAFVCDDNQNLVPIGVIGELYIGGAGVARGYLNQIDLSKERFIENIFASASEKKQDYTHLYSTGDLVRWLPDGNLEYIGRKDFQVKIRGFRVELSEIEYALSLFPGIKQSVILARKRESSQHLIAYYTSEKVIDNELLISHLSKHLPDYMIPSTFVLMESFPATINGKLDRAALPIPDFTAKQSSYVAPKRELEKTLCIIWQDVLGLERVGILDDFFRLGGDSILSIQLTSRMRQKDLDCSVKAIFEHRCIERLAHALDTAQVAREIHGEQGVLAGQFGLLPIQSLFFERALSQPNHWNQSFLVNVPELSMERLESILPILMRQHDMLRVHFIRNEHGVMEQAYSASIDKILIKQLDVSLLDADAIDATLSLWQSAFDIQDGPLWQIGYLHGYVDSSARIYFALHHLVVDSVSWRILIDNLKQLYAGDSLAEKSSSYRQWVSAVQTYAMTHQDEIDYWCAQLNDCPDYRIHALSKTEHHELVQLDKVTTQQLIEVANRAYHTEINDLLLTALAYTLVAWQDDVHHVITLEAHGREAIDDTVDTSQTVGWFTTKYPVRLGIQKTLEASIKHIKEDLRHIPTKGLGFGALKYHEQNNALTSATLPAISFNYLGQFDNQTGYWQVVDESSGQAVHVENINQDLIDINGLVIDGRLQFSLVMKLEKEVSRQFADTFQKQLIRVTRHCVANVENDQLIHTPHDFSPVQISMAALDKLQACYELEVLYPATSLQQGFIYQALSQPDDDAYRVQLLFDYHNELDVITYKKAWSLVIEEYPSLRLCFNWDNELIQIITKTGVLDFTVHDISMAEDKDQAVAMIQEKDRTEPFDLTKPTLLRLHFIKHSGTHYTLLRSMHHSISDGWSGFILMKRVHGYYSQLRAGNVPCIIKDTSYLRAQTYITQHQDKANAYWQAKVSQVEHANDLNALFSHSVDLDAIKVLSHPCNVATTLEGDDYNALKKWVKQTGLTLTTVVQFAWHKLIQTYTQDKQTIVGTTLSGRALPIAGIEDSVGPYINTLPIIIDWDNGRTVRQQLQFIHKQLTELDEYGFAHLARLQRDGIRLFHSLSVFENYPIDYVAFNEQEVGIKFRGSVEKLDYPLALMAYEAYQGLHCILQYDETYLTTSKAEQLLTQLQIIIRQLSERLDKPQHVVSLLSPQEYQQIIYDWNARDCTSPADKTIHALFEAQAARTPENIALVYEGETLCYGDLDKLSNQLASTIKAHYQDEDLRDRLIGLCVSRSMDM